MAQVFDIKKRKWEKVKSIKNLSFPGFEKFKFFLHVNLERNGYCVSERTSGASVGEGWTSRSAIERAEQKLNFYGVIGLRQAIEKALEEHHD